MDGGHLSPDGIHVMAQGNLVLLQLIPIGIEAGSECMDLVSQGPLSTGSLALGVAVRTSSSVSSSKVETLLGLSNFTLGSGMGRRCCTCFSESNIITMTDRHSLVIREGWIRAPVQCP